MNRIDLSGRRAIITGAAGGLGKVTAHRMLQSGARVALWDMDPKAVEAARQELSDVGPCSAHVVDVSDEASVAKGFAESLAGAAAVDILVNAAGTSSAVMPCIDYPLITWNKVLAVHLTGTFLCCKAVLPGMIAQRYGRILNVSSMAGKEGNAEQSAYSAAKAGVIGLTKCMAREIAETGVLVNAIAPGAFDGPLVQGSAAVRPDVIQTAINKIPMKRMGMPEEFAELACWIVSDGCSFTTGFTFDVSGGRATY